METQKEVRSLRQRVGIMIAGDPATVVKTLVRLEEEGVDRVWVPFGPIWNPDVLTTLAAVAARTSHLKFGTNIVQVTSRHPTFMAQQILSIDSLAPGRFTLGIGTGSAITAKATYGTEMKAPLTYLRNYIQVLRPLLQQGEIHHQEPPFITDVKLSAATQTPIYISALGPAAFRLAGEIADGALPFLSPIPYLLNTAIPALSEGATIAGRARPPVVAHLPIAITNDRTAARQAARQQLSFYTTLPTYRNMFTAAGFSEQEISTTSDTLIDSLIVSGDEHQIKDRLQEILSSEIDSLVINIVPISDAAQEGARLARLVSNL